MAITIERPDNASAVQKAIRTSATTTVAGTVPGGFFICGFYNIGLADITVDGQTLPAGAAEVLPYVGKQYSEPVTYNASGSTLLIKAIW